MWDALERAGVGAALGYEEFAALMRPGSGGGDSSSDGSSGASSSSGSSDGGGGGRDSMSGSVLSVGSQQGCGCGNPVAAPPRAGCGGGSSGLVPACCSGGSCASAQERLPMGRASTCPAAF
jgi:hypothetical protein